tara:strand:+ start:2135 stop:2905 length:771 start_codon:yes stop_codon:yes gene_type:complete
MVKFQSFVLALTLIECLGVAVIIGIRCYADEDMDCNDLKGKSVSFLLDWYWLQNLAAVLLGGASFLNIFFAFWLLYPHYSKQPFWGPEWYYWMLRVLHSLGFVGVATVGVFNLGTYEEIHMMAAFWLFILLSAESIAVLFMPRNRCNVYKLLFANRDWAWYTTAGFLLQIVHAVMNGVFVLLYLIQDNGVFEWLGIWGILLYANWFSRDHWNDEITVLVRINKAGNQKQDSVELTVLSQEHPQMLLLRSIHNRSTN